MALSLTVRDIASHVGGTASGDLDRPITGVSSPAAAGPHHIVFVESEKYGRQLAESSAGAALVPRGTPVPPGLAVIEVENPARAMARVVDLIVPPRGRVEGVSPLAHVGRDVTIGEGAGIGPFVSIGDRVCIGKGADIHPGATIGADTTIGDDCVIYAGVHIYHEITIGHRVILHSGAVIGADGFGYVQDKLSGDPGGDPIRHCKVRQVGRVVLEDDVEVGANSAIDRATYQETRIGRGTKIDNLVTIGHNCTIGRHCIIIGQAGISGSTSLGNYVVIAGQAGLISHLTIGDGVVVGGQAGVGRSLEAGERVLGSPAIEGGRAKRAIALFGRLPEFRRAIADHGRRLARLEAKTSGEPSSED